eukprot:403370215
MKTTNLRFVKRNTVDEILHGFDDQLSSQGSLDSSQRDILQMKDKSQTLNLKQTFDIDIKNNQKKLEDNGFEKSKKQELHNKPTWKYSNDIDGKILTDSQSLNEPTILEIVTKCYQKICADPFNNEDQQNVLTRKQQEDEWIVGAWMNIHPKNIEQEIKHCMIRNEVENIFFKFKFFYKINEEYRNRFLNYDFVRTWEYNESFETKRYLQFTKFFRQTQQKLELRRSLGKSSIRIDPKKNDSSTEFKIAYLQVPSKEDLSTNYPGRLYFRELFQMSKHLAPYKQLKGVFIVSFVHSILPLVIELYQDYNDEDFDQRQAKYKSVSYWLYTLPLMIFTFIFYRANTIFLQMAITDLHRRKLNMIFCEVQLEPNRFKVKDKFLCVPLINFFDPKTLQSWLDLRIMAQDMGIRFKLRLDSYVYFFMVAYGLVGSLWLGWFFELFTEYEIQFSLVVTIGFELSMVCLIIYKVFYFGAWVNEISNKQILRIVELRNVLERFKSEWKDAQYYGSLEDKLINNTFKDAYRYFTYMKNEFGLKKCMLTINRSLEVLNAIEQRLEREIEFNPISIFGIPLTVTILNALKTAMATLIFTMINFKFKFIS